MSTKRRKFSKEFKAKVVLEALKERETLESLAKKYELQPTQISLWKAQAMSNFSILFSQGSKPEEEISEAELESLYAQIGKLQVQNDFLKKKLQ
jgi:transposase-like protein